MRNRCTEVILELAWGDRRVLALTADTRNDPLKRLQAERPEQSVDYGIAESNMIASAAGLASCGKIPFVYAITNFLAMRAYEFIRVAVCQKPWPVKLIGTGAGVASSGLLGFTHQGTEDLALLRSLPNLPIVTAASPREAALATRAVFAHDGPAYLRLEGDGEAEIYDENYEFVLGRGVMVRPGSDVTVITMGSVIQEALRAADTLQREQGLSVRLINMHTAKPIDEDIIERAAKETRGVLTLEEHSLYGGLGGAVAEVMAAGGWGTPLKMMGLSGFAQGCGDRSTIREINGLSEKDIISNLRSLLRW